MPKLKLKKPELKKLKAIADRMPVSFVEMDVKRAVRGDQLIELGIETVKNGKPVNPKATYMAPVTDKKFVDHYRRMRRIYESGKGMEGVNAYVRGVLEVNSRKDVSVGGIQLVS